MVNEFMYRAARSIADSFIDQSSEPEIAAALRDMDGEARRTELVGLVCAILASHGFTQASAFAAFAAKQIGSGYPDAAEVGA